MKARQRILWTAGLATAIAVAGMGEVGAQQAPSNFANIRAPQSIGFNPNALSPFAPSIQRPFSGAFAPVGMMGGNGTSLFGFTPMTPFFAPSGFADIRAPQSLALNPGIVSPFTPNIRQPLTGTFNAAANVPIVTGSVPIVTGDVSTGFSNGSQFFVGPSGVYWLPNGQAVQPVPVPVAVPVPVTVEQQRAMAARQAPRHRLRLTPTPERRSLQAAERTMARAPLTEGIVVSADRRNVKVRVASRVRTYPRSQVFFFTTGGEMRSAAVQTSGMSRGLRVLVPASSGRA
jgi:hypothetical protein